MAIRSPSIWILSGWSGGSASAGVECYINLYNVLFSLMHAGRRLSMLFVPSISYSFDHGFWCYALNGRAGQGWELLVLLQG